MWRLVLVVGCVERMYSNPHVSVAALVGRWVLICLLVGGCMLSASTRGRHSCFH